MPDSAAVRDETASETGCGINGDGALGESCSQLPRIVLAKA
jgi:hypothetical protein